MSTTHYFRTCLAAGPGLLLAIILVTLSQAATTMAATTMAATTMAATTMAATTAGAADPKPLLQFRLAETRPIAGAESVIIPDSGVKVWLRPEIVLSEAQLDSAVAVYGDFGLEIALKLEGEGRRRLAAVTRDNVGRHLVILFDGRLLMAPVIQDPIDSDRVTITGAGKDERQLDAFLDRLAPLGVGVRRFAETEGGIGQNLPTREETREQLLAGWEETRARLDSCEGRYTTEHLQAVTVLDELAMLLETDYEAVDKATEIILKMEEIVRARLGQDHEEVLHAAIYVVDRLCDVGLYDRAESLVHDLLAELGDPRWQKPPSRLIAHKFCDRIADHYVEQGDAARAERLYQAVVSGPIWIAYTGFMDYVRFLLDQGRRGDAEALVRRWQVALESEAGANVQIMRLMIDRAYELLAKQKR